jgi:quercetin dioxygenase-like cupin family protein
MRTNPLGLVLLLCFGIAADAHAEGCGESIVVMPNELAWKGAPVPGLETAVICGDPAKAGVYVMRVRFPPAFKLMPHFHPDEWRTGVVLSGNYYFGLGEQWDESRLKAYSAGTFFSEPKGTPHFVWAKDGEVIVQFTGMGPSGVTRIPQKQMIVPTQPPR